MFFWFVVSVRVLSALLARGSLSKGILFEEMLAGVIGGYASSFMRMYKTEHGKDLVASIQTLRNGIAGLIEKPPLGGIFALVLHLLFISKALARGMFPSLSILELGNDAKSLRTSLRVRLLLHRQISRRYSYGASSEASLKDLFRMYWTQWRKRVQSDQYFCGCRNRG
jgi:hypothetical protein